MLLTLSILVDTGSEAQSACLSNHEAADAVLVRWFFGSINRHCRRGFPTTKEKFGIGANRRPKRRLLRYLLIREESFCMSASPTSIPQDR